MKINMYYIGMLALLISSASCKKDNFEAPANLLTGRLHYNNDTINVEHDRVPFELYQYGFGKVGPIGQTFDQEGKYSSLLFNGEYKLIIRNGQGPFMWPKTAAGDPDSISITINGGKTLDIPVIPYYMPRNGVVSSRGRNINASFKTQKIVGGTNGKNIEYVSIYINKTQFVSGTDNVATRLYANDAIIDTNKIEFTKFIAPTEVLQSYYFVRMGIKMSGVEDLIFTPVLNVNLGEIEHYTRVQAETGALFGGAVIDSLSNDNSQKFINNITATGAGVDVKFTAPAAGTYIINVGGGTDVKASTHTVYTDGNAGSAKTALYPKQGVTNFDVSPVEFDLTAGLHTISIRKNATNTGKVQIDWVDFFKLK